MMYQRKLKLSDTNYVSNSTFGLIYTDRGADLITISFVTPVTCLNLVTVSSFMTTVLLI